MDNDNRMILLVEDEVILAMSEKMMLEEFGYAVITVTTGEKAVKAIAENTQIDLIVMDIDLGKGIDGTEAAETILQGKNIPVVFCSSHTEPDVIAKTEKITSYGYLVKGSSGTVYDASIKMAFKLFEANAIVKKELLQRKRLEAALEKRIVALTRPLDAVENILFDDLFDLTTIQRIQDEFSNATGVASLITLPDGTPITNPSNFTRLCQLFRNNKQGCANCEKSDAVLGKLHEGGSVVQHCLSGGLWDAGASITIENRHVATWLVGQVRDESQNEDAMRAYARTIGADEEKVAAAFHEVPSMSLQKFTRVTDALFVFANQLSQIAYQNVQQARLISERNQAEKDIKDQLVEKEILLKEVHHRMKNNISSIASFLSLQVHSMSNPEAVHALQDAITRVQGMRILYDKLLLSKDYREVSGKGYLEDLIRAISAVFPESQNITVEKQIADFKINTKIIISVGIIVNELFTNIYKYAFVGRDNGFINIMLTKTDNQITLVIKDNGNGIDERVALNKSSNFGLTIINILAEQLDGTFSIESDQGTISTLKFKL